jgi:RNA polymerase-binding transcription factor DksA
MQQEPEKNRFSDEELEEFRVLIEQKLDEAKKQLDHLQEQLTELNESGETSKAGTFEEGAFNWQREHLNKLASRQQRFIRDLEHALIRVRNKTYGVCTVTGKLISKERLRLVPHATKSVEGKESLDENSKTKKNTARTIPPADRAPQKRILSKVISQKKNNRSEGEEFDFLDDEDELDTGLDFDGLVVDGHDD